MIHISPENFQLPAALSTDAANVDALYMLVYWFSVVFTVGVTGTMLYFVWKYRRRPGHKAEPVTNNTTLEVTWTVLPIFFVAILFHLGFKEYAHDALAASNALEIGVRGQQWSWNFTYPNGKQDASEVTIPVNRPVKFVISSQDVIHSFYVPGARLKKDAVPGMYSSITFTPNTIGDMQVFCAEYCGKSHSGMLAKIHVVAEKDYEDFLKKGDRLDGEPLDAYGARLYKKNACYTCHTVDGSKGNGPTWKDMYGHSVTMTSGQTLTADDNYI
ncbi:MAG: cytochrome c oxidase subunit II, partial [Polyangiaceae bacterium]